MINPGRPHKLQTPLKSPVPTIKISLDQLIKETYLRLADGEVKTILESKIPKSNPLILEYIKSIYQNYRIVDPLQSKQHPSISRSRRVSASEEKIRRMKRDSANYTPSTQKPANSTASIKKRITQPNRLDLTIGSQNKYLNDMSPQSQVELPQQNTKKEVQVMFRYCVMCQSPILDHNILAHESRCHQFHRLYTCSNRQIVNIIQSRVDRLKSQIKVLISDRSPLIRKQQEQSIKSSVREWINEVEQSLSDMNFGLKYKRLYDEALKSFSNNSIRLAELVKRLKWFVRIREQLKREFGI